MARHDALTGLANGTLLMEKILAMRWDACGGAARNSRSLCSILDRFKTVNDSLGRPAGDALLKEVARRLQNITRDVDCVARLGGDEFAILQASEPDQERAAMALSERILKVMVEPCDLNGRKVTLETSIGITLAPNDGTGADALIKNADLALYKAKAEGRNRYCFFEASMDAEARERHLLEGDLRMGLLRNEFELHYQVIVNLDTRKNTSASKRWCAGIIRSGG